MWSFETIWCEMKNLQAETVATNLIINDFWVAMVSDFSWQSIKDLTKVGMWAHTHTHKIIANEQNLGLK